jgi:hypothetical protein
LKLAFRFGVVASIVTNIFGIDTTRSGWEIKNNNQWYLFDD